MAVIKIRHGTRIQNTTICVHDTAKTSSLTWGSPVSGENPPKEGRDTSVCSPQSYQTEKFHQRRKEISWSAGNQSKRNHPRLTDGRTTLRDSTVGVSMVKGFSCSVVFAGSWGLFTYRSVNLSAYVECGKIWFCSKTQNSMGKRDPLNNQAKMGLAIIEGLFRGK